MKIKNTNFEYFLFNFAGGWSAPAGVFCSPKKCGIFHIATIVSFIKQACVNQIIETKA